MANLDTQARPEPKFEIGDTVSFVNDYGCKFPELTIVDRKFDKNEWRYFYKPSSSPWYPVKESDLIADVDDLVLNIVGGHKIRTEKHGDEAWFLVGQTKIIFRDKEEAEDFAKRNPVEQEQNLPQPT